MVHRTYIQTSLVVNQDNHYNVWVYHRPKIINTDDLVGGYSAIHISDVLTIQGDNVEFFTELAAAAGRAAELLVNPELVEDGEEHGEQVA